MIDINVTDGVLIITKVNSLEDYYTGCFKANAISTDKIEIREQGNGFLVVKYMPLAEITVEGNAFATSEELIEYLKVFLPCSMCGGNDGGTPLETPIVL